MSCLESNFEHLSLDVNKKIHDTTSQISTKVAGVSSQVDNFQQMMAKTQDQNCSRFEEMEDQIMDIKELL
eukprot:12413171-Karenia_brevis.AAC.1